MLGLLLKMLLLPPSLLMSHAKAYADLANEVGARYLCTLKNRWVLYGLSAMSFMMALFFGGVALLLWSALSLHEAPHAWVLLALPAATLLVSALCWWGARRLRVQPLLQDIQAQIALDIRAIQQSQPT